MDRHAKTALGVTLSLFLAFGSLGFWFWRLINVDYSSWTPEVAFTRVLRVKYPENIRSLKIAGHGGGVSGRIWMSFQTTDAGLRQLRKASRSKWDSTSIQDWQIDTSNMPDEFRRDSAAIEWPKNGFNRYSERYGFGTGTSEGWYGQAFWDPKTSKCFLWAELL